MGSALTPLLKEAGHQVVALKRPLATSSAAGLDAIVHLAGLAHSRDGDPEAYRVANVQTTSDVAELARTSGASRLIFLSTSLVYGPKPGGAPLTGRSSVNPKGHYAQSKLEAEQLLHDRLGQTLGLNILRPPVVYGPGVKGNLRHIVAVADRGIPLPRLQARRSYLSLQHLNAAIAGLIEADPPSTPFTSVVADAQPVVVKDLFAALGTHRNNRMPTLPGSQLVEPIARTLNERLLGDRFSALFEDLSLDARDITRALPNFVPADTLDELPQQMLG